MAEAEKYGPPQVAPAPMSSARLNPNEPLEAFGGGRPTAEATGEVTGIGRDLQRIGLEEQEKTNQIALTDASAKAQALATKLMYDQNNGLVMKEGLNAIGDAPNQVMDSWHKGLDEIAGGLTSPEQQEAFQRHATHMTGELDKQVQVHVAGERRRYDDQVTTAKIAEAQNAGALAAGDPEGVEYQAWQVDAARQLWADRNGLAPAVAKFLIAQDVSKVYAGAVTQLLDNQQDLDAKKYFEQIQDKLTAQDRGQLAKAVEVGSTLGEAQRNSDRIVSVLNMREAIAGAGGIGAGLMKSTPETALSKREQALAEVKKIEDPKVRQMTQDLVLHDLAQQKEAIAEKQAQDYINMSQLVRQPINAGKPLEQIVPPSIMARLTPEHYQALERMQKDVPNNTDAWHRFITMPFDQMAKLTQDDFETLYYSRFDPTHRERADTMWREAIDSVRKKTDTPELSNLMTYRERLHATLADYADAFNKTPEQILPEDKRLYNQFDQQAASAINAFEKNDLQGKRHATGDEMQGIMDKLLIKNAFTKGWFGRPGDALPSAMVKKDNLYLSEADTKTWSNIITHYGKQVTDDKLQRMQRASLEGKNDLVQRIAQE